MQDPPHKTELLEAVVRFLDQDLRGSIADRGLAFRVRIASNLVRMVASECRHAEAHDQAELERLRDLVSGAPDQDIAQLNAALAARVRQGELDAAAQAVARERLMETLRDKLAVINPRFDTRMEIES